MSLDFAAINPAAARAEGAASSSGGDLPDRAQYVVVGGGVIGTSIAYHLALLGATDVVLLERKQLTSGTTWHAAGEVVSGGTTEDALWMARYSAELYARLEEETGLSTGFRQCGYLQLATTPRADEGFRRETAYMRSVGMTKEVLSPKEVADLVPLMRTDDVIHGFWTPDEGRANPVDVTMSLAKGAKQRGARIFENTEVTDFILERGRVVGVRTERGDIECEKVVIAAGLWGREVAAKAGVTVPLQAAEHYYLLTEPIAGVTPESVPVIEDGEAYGYYREEGGGLLVGMFEPVGKAWALDGTPRDSAFAVLPPDWDRMTPFLEVAMRRFPALEDAGIRTLFCGPESFTDDLSPMLGESPEVDGLYLACGLNSVGILSGGGLGHMMAQWLIEEHPPLDVTGVGVDRAHEFQATRMFREQRTVERLGFLLNDLAWPNAQPRLGRERAAVAVPPAARRRRRPPRHHQRLGVPRLLRRRGRHADGRVGLRARRGLRAHPRGAPQRPRELRGLRHVADVAPRGAGPARDGGAQPGLLERRRHRGRPGRLHAVAGRARRDHRRRHGHPAGRGRVRRDQRRQHPPPGAGLDPQADPRGRVRHRHRRDQRARRCCRCRARGHARCCSG